MSGNLSNLLLLIIGGVFLVGMFYAFFKVIFSKNIHKTTNQIEKKPIKPTEKNLKPKFTGRT